MRFDYEHRTVAASVRGPEQDMLCLTITMGDSWQAIIPLEDGDASVTPDMLRSIAAAAERHLAKSEEQKAAEYVAALAEHLAKTRKAGEALDEVDGRG